MKLDRKISPLIESVSNVSYIDPETILLNSGIPLYTMRSGDLEVVKIDFTFKAGIWYSKSKLDSAMAAGMLQEGTANHNASEIANTLDFFGAHFSSGASFDNSYISILSLKKHLPVLLPLVSEMIRAASFPVEEFEIIRQKRKQRAIIDFEKVSLIAQRSFLQNIFGMSHPYAPPLNHDLYDYITCDEARTHYLNYYNPDNMTIIASGFVDDEVKQLMESNFGMIWRRSNVANSEKEFVLPLPQKELFVEREGATQNAIAIGKLFPSYNHPDFHGLRLLCTILGGYFGSRLMTNIREEKGLTYSIHASPITFIRNGVFLVFAEVKTSKTEEAVKEIFIEMEKLCTDLINEEELTSVQNYMLGRILEEFDGPFARAQNFMALNEAKLNFNFYNDYINVIRSTTPFEIRELARKYFVPETMSTVVAGVQ